ncbi:MAG: hypothetical protein Q4D02_07360 [Clostridia bacterium]|nr:hypothetical protein [Clostridia bacterium]
MGRRREGSQNNDLNIKSHSKLKSFFKYIISFTLIGTLITVPTLMYVDNFIYKISQSSINSNPIRTSNEEEIGNALNITLEDGITDLQISYNNKYYTYLKDSKIYINDLETGENINIIEEEYPICYYNLLYDKNMIMYFVEYEGRYASTLTLNTYEIDTERQAEYNSFTVYNFSKIKDMSMSPIVNMIYINVETKTQYSSNNIIYKIDLFNNMNQVKSGLIIDKMYMLQHKDKIYYEDTRYNIYSGGYYTLNLFKEDVTMIGLDEDDNLYFLTEDTKNKVYVVKDNEIINTIELSDSDIVDTYTNYKGVYLIYPTYILKVSGDDPYKRIGKLSKYVTFEAVKGDTMYLRTKDNKLISTELLKN